MAPPRHEIGHVLHKHTAADVVTPQAALFDAGPFSTGEIVVHTAGVVLNLCTSVLLVLLGVEPVVAGSSAGPGTVAVLITAVLVGWFLADLISGVLHWAFDTWFSEDITAVRRMVLLVREHHVYPQQIFKYRWKQEVGIMSWFGFLLGGAALAVLPGAPVVAFGVASSALVASAGVSFSLEVHKLGHEFSPAPVVRILQRCGLILSTRHHMKHHAREHDINYYIVNGWADDTLGRLGLFRGLERAAGRMGAGSPRSDDRAWRRVFGRWVAD